MKNANLLFKTPMFWVLIYGMLVTIALIVVSISYSNHECPKPIVPEISKKHIQTIKKINDAQTLNDIDSLLMELYGFKSK